MARPEALLWDVDGTLAESERDGHRVAFNRACEAYRRRTCWRCSGSACARCRPSRSRISPGGVAAARAADVPVIVTRSSYFATATIEGAIAIGPGLHTRRGWRPSQPPLAADQPVGLDDIAAWCAEMDLVSQHA
jgi:hypothetical protein